MQFLHILGYAGAACRLPLGAQNQARDAVPRDPGSVDWGHFLSTQIGDDQAYCPFSWLTRT